MKGSVSRNKLDWVVQWWLIWLLGAFWHTLPSIGEGRGCQKVMMAITAPLKPLLFFFTCFNCGITVVILTFLTQTIIFTLASPSLGCRAPEQSLPHTYINRVWDFPFSSSKLEKKPFGFAEIHIWNQVLLKWQFPLIQTLQRNSYLLPNRSNVPDYLGVQDLAHGRFTLLVSMDGFQ